ncbi:MAG: peptidase family protein [Ilumatobacteraceae bacterium]|nr:peptidase family protein [Ilumatobacteraceae bacterium]MCU1387253.1 peptidase family protein [Ilumatobacteraceae bacterium]
MAIMPMFPLGSVLLPGAVLPLHVFEPRYRQLVQDCLASPEHEFGVVLITRGLEVGGGDVRCSVGTVARMIQVAELDDGRYALVTVGTRRVQVVEWLPDDPYPQAVVDELPDEDADEDLTDRIGETWTRVRRMNALAIELGDANADVSSEMSADPLVASYHLSALAPLGPADQQRLLAARGPRERIDLLEAALDDAQALQQFRLQHPSSGSDFDSDFGEP